MTLGNLCPDFACHGSGLRQTALRAALRGSRSALALAFTAWGGSTTARRSRGRGFVWASGSPKEMQPEELSGFENHKPGDEAADTPPVFGGLGIGDHLLAGGECFHGTSICQDIGF